MGRLKRSDKIVSRITPTELESLQLNTKRTLRQLVLSRRDAIDSTARETRSHNMCQKLGATLESHFAHWDQKTGHPTLPTIALYNALKSEVDLTHLAQFLTNKAWSVCYPIMLTSDLESLPGHHRPTASAFHPMHAMAFYAAGAANTDVVQEIFSHPLRTYDPAELQRFGLTLISPQTIDAIMVPLVAFDPNNHRLGYGGGNYDNFLPLLRDDCLITGVAFEEQQVDHVPIEPHDLPLPSIAIG